MLGPSWDQPALQDCSWNWGCKHITSNLMVCLWQSLQTRMSPQTRGYPHPPQVGVLTLSPGFLASQLLLMPWSQVLATWDLLPLAPPELAHQATLPRRVWGQRVVNHGHRRTVNQGGYSKGPVWQTSPLTTPAHFRRTDPAQESSTRGQA